MQLGLKILLLLFIPFLCFSQNKKSEYSTVDNKILALSLYKADNLDSLAVLLTKDFSSEKEKTRAVYFWVANNITYNIPKYAERRNAMNVILKKKDESEAAEKIIQTRKAICEGYSNLVKALCDRAGVRCEIVEGIGQPQKNQYDLHAWNAVMIEGEWKLLDATWSAGGIDMKKNIFHKDFEDNFFLMPPSEFIKTHYPFDPAWQLLFHPLHRKDFESSKTFSSDTTGFNFNDTLNFYFKQDSISQLISSTRRTLEFDPENNFAEQNLNNLLNYSENEKMNQATLIFQQGVNHYNECTEIINEAKRTRSTKKMNANETKLKQLLKDSKSNMEKAIEIYKTVKFSDNSNAFILKQNIENGKSNLKQLDDLNKYLENYFSTPKIMRIYKL
jgi:hypothetical protein